VDYCDDLASSLLDSSSVSCGSSTLSRSVDPEAPRDSATVIDLIGSAMFDPHS
jgi:hypothetical protein